MAIRTPDAPEDEKSRIDQHYDEALSPLEQLRRLEEVRRKHPDATPTRDLKNSEEEAGKASESSSEGDSLQEKERRSGWKTDYQQQDQKGSKKGLAGIVGKVVNKKTGPAVLLSGSIIGIILFLFGATPALLLVHIGETLTSKFNTPQETTLIKRYQKIFAHQISGEATKGCTAITKAICRYEGISQRQLDLFEKGGVKVTATKGRFGFGRYKPTKFEFKGTTIPASGFKKALESDRELLMVSREVYNPRFATIADKLANRVFTSKFKTSRADPFRETANNDEARDETLRKTVNEGDVSGTINGKAYVQDKDGNWIDPDDPDGTPVDEATARAHNATLEIGGEMKEGIGTITETGNKTSGDIMKEAESHLNGGGKLNAVKGFFSVTSVVDAGCSMHGAMQAVSYGAKTIRTLQMARYAMIFLSSASIIKAGDATPENVNYLNNILTKTVNETVVDDAGNEVTRRTKAATDSYGFRYAAYGDTGPLTSSASQFLAGGGMGGKLFSSYNTILGLLPGDKATLDRTCKIAGNPFVQGTSILAGVLLTIFTGGVGKVIQESAESAVIAVAMTAVGTVLMGYLQDIMAGVLVDGNTFGEATGDAITSGTGALLSGVAGVGGNAPLKPEQAVAFSRTQKEILAQNAEEDRATHSPLDATNQNTFLGQIVFQLLPYMDQSSLSGLLTAPAAVTSKTVASIVTPSVLADDTIEDYTQCQDYDYRAMGLATDPFCNPVRGIPVTYLESTEYDPIEVANRMVNNGHVNEQDGSPESQEYKNFVKNCIDREAPLGYEVDGSDGSECFLDEQWKADFYLYRMDSRILEGMDEGYDEGDGLVCFEAEPGSGSSGAQKIPESELKQLMTSYGLPEPQAQGERGYETLLKNIQGNPDATWATASMLAGEKNFKNKGGEIKEYLTTAWLWHETGIDSWADPYEVNCNDDRDGYVSEVQFFCGVQNFQVAGYQAENRRRDYVEIFKKFYSEGELGSVLQKVVANSSKASQDKWDYNDPSQQKGLVASYIDSVGSASLSDISPNTDFFDQKGQFLTLILGKDPNMAAALNSFAVSDGDVVAMLRDCTSLPWSNNRYYCNPALRQDIANIMMALYLFDGTAAGSADLCAKESTKRGGGAGISAIWGGKGERDLSYGFGADAGLKLYEYGIEMGMGGSGTLHTGVDIPDEKEAPIYSPVNGIVMCTGTGKGTSVDGTGCGAFNDYQGQGNGRIEIKPDGTEDILILGHTSTSTVEVGQRVTIGQQVGTVGYMNGWHTHAEVRVKDSGGWRLVDPEEYLGGA